MRDLRNMMSRMREANAKVEALQRQVEALEATGEAGAGAVKATVNGQKFLNKLEIDPVYLKPSEREVLQDLVIAAVQSAQHDVEDQVHEIVKKHTGGVMGSLPLDTE